jgi:hypothetical protein
MDVLGCVTTANKVGKYLILAVFAVNLLSISFAGPGASAPIASALKELCQASQVFLGAAIMIMILLAGATYALGQVLGAETRARATVWATAMMTGAIIGALIYLLTPIIVKALLPGGPVSINTANPCG